MAYIQRIPPTVERPPAPVAMRSLPICWSVGKAVARDLKRAAVHREWAAGSHSAMHRAWCEKEARFYLNRARSIRIGAESPNPFSRWSA